MIQTVFDSPSMFTETTCSPEKACKNEAAFCLTQFLLTANHIYHIEVCFIKIKPSLYSWYYAESCNEWRAHLRNLAPGQHSCEGTSQRW